MLTEDSFVDFTCPHCGGAVSFPQDSKGSVRECLQCSAEFIVPDDGSVVGRKVPLPATTRRLVLRRFAPEDWQDLLEMMPDAEEDFVLAWLQKDAQIRLGAPEQSFQLGIELMEKSKLIGYLTLKILDENRQAEMSFEMNEKYQESDLTVEALDGLLGFCFEGIGLHRMTAVADGEDEDKRKVFEELGLRREAEFIKDHLVSGEWRTSVWYAALKEEFLGTQGEKID